MLQFREDHRQGVSGMGVCQGREGEMNDPEEKEEKVGRKDQIKFNVKRQSLGADGEMSEVNIPPPHNLVNPHALVVRNKNPVTCTETAYVPNLSGKKICVTHALTKVFNVAP